MAFSTPLDQSTVRFVSALPTRHWLPVVKNVSLSVQIWCISSVLLRSVHFQVNLLLGFDTFLQTFADVHLHKWFFCELFVHVVWPNENSVLFEGLLCRDIVSELFCALGKENWLEVCLTEVKLLSILLKLVLLLEEVSLHQNVRVACQSWN